MDPIFDPSVPASERFDRLYATRYHNSFKLKSDATKLLKEQQELRAKTKLALKSMQATSDGDRSTLNAIGKKVIGYTKRSFMISIELYGNTHYSCLEDGIILSRLLTNAGLYVPALTTLDICAKIQASDSPHPHPVKCLKICHALGDIYMQHKNKMENAKRCYIQSTIIADKRFGQLDSRTASCYHDVSSFFTKIGDIELALHFEGKALLIKTASYGIYSKQTIETQRNVAILYRLLRQYEKALTEFQKVHDAYAKLYGVNSLEVATTNVSIGYTYKNMNYLLMAEQAYKEAFLIRREILGEGHRKTNEARKLLDEVIAPRIGGAQYGGQGGEGSLPFGKSNYLPPPSSSKNGKRDPSHSKSEKFKVSEVMRAIGKVGDRTYVPPDLRKQLLMACEENSYLTENDIRGFKPEGSALETCVLNSIASQLTKNKGIIGSLKDNDGKEIFGCGSGYGFINSHATGNVPQVTVYFNSVAKAIADCNEDAKKNFSLPPFDRAFVDKVQNVMPTSGSITMNKLKRELLAGDGAYFDQEVGILINKIKENMPNNMSTVANQMTSCLPVGYGIGGVGGGELTLNATGVENTVRKANYLKPNKVVSDRVIEVVRETIVKESMSGFFTTGQLSAALNGKLPDEEINKFVGILESSAEEYLQQEMQKIRGRAGTVMRGKNTNNGITADKIRSESVTVPRRPMGKKRVKIVAYSANELWELFYKKLLCSGHFFRQASELRTKRRAVKVGAFAIFPKILREAFLLRTLNRAQKPLLALGIIRYGLTGKQARVQQSARKFTGVLKAGMMLKRKAKKAKTKIASSKYKQVSFGKNETVTNTEGTMWAKQGRRASFVNFVSDDLEKQFSKTAAKPKNEKPKKPKKEKANILPSKENQNISMAVFKITKKLSHEELVDSLNQLDGQSMGAEVLEILAKLVQPINMFKSKVKAWKPNNQASFVPSRDMKLFTPAEKLIWYVADVKQLPLRIKCLYFIESYREVAGPLTKNCKTLSAACNDVLESKRLPKVMEYILVLANHLNQGGSNANLSGIRLSGLARVTMTRSSKGVNLLEFLVEKLQRKEEDLLNLKDDFKYMVDATFLSSSTMKSEMKQLLDGVQALKRSINSANDRNDHIWEDSLGPYCSKIELVVDDVKEKFEKAAETFKKACKYLAEDPNKIQYESFFSTLKGFIDLFNKAIETINLRRKKEEAKKKREEEKKRRDEARQKREERKSPSPVLMVEKPESEDINPLLKQNSQAKVIADEAENKREAILSSMAMRRRQMRMSVADDKHMKTQSRRKLLRASSSQDSNVILEEEEEEESDEGNWLD